MQSSLDRFLRKRQAPSESNCGEEEQCQEKEPRTTEATKDSSSRKHYEKKRKQEGRTFRQEWKKTFAWLQFDETKEEMFCTACREFSSIADRNSSFFTGSQAFHIGNIKAHASNRKHEACVLAKQQREQQERGSMNIVQSLRQMSNDTEEKMKKLFNISYFIAKYERPFSDFEDLCKLHVKNGLSLGETYINDKGCRAFVEAIDGVMKEDESQQMNKQCFISVMADSGTDTSNKDLELVYVRFLENGLPVNKYVAVVELKNADANGVIASINTGMVEFGLENWKSQTVAFGSDGASVYVGRLNGVVAKLRLEIPWLLGVHCIAHRLELSVLDALKDEEQLKTVQEMLQGLYKHYHYSPKALRELKELAQLLDEKINKPVNLRGTRWLPHISRALTVMIKSFSVIYAHLENTISENASSVEMRGRARKTVNVLSSFRNLLFIHLVLDVLAIFKALSLLFQRDNIVISAAKDGLYSTELQLRAMIARPGKNLQGFLDEVGDGHIYKGVTLKRMPNDLNAFIRDKQRMINTIIQFLNSRFESLDSDPVLVAGKIFDPRVWPESVEDLAAYGEAEVDCLVQHFRPALERNDFDFAAVAGEWSALKACVTANNFRHLDPLILWQRMFTAFKDQFPNILMLVEIILILPLATATVERGFSAMKRVKNDWRSCLETDILNMLLRIAINGCSFDIFDPQRAIQHWWTSGQRARRPDFQRNT